MSGEIRGRFLPIARIHRTRETVFEQAARAQLVVVRRAEQTLEQKREAVALVETQIRELIEERNEKVLTGSDELTRFDLRMISVRAARDQASKDVEVAVEQLAQEQRVYRELMRKVMREHEFVDVAMSQHRNEKRKHEQKTEIALEESIADSMSRPITSLSFT
jgi:hypothetical protein